jgi:hypothetical protein
MADTDGGGESPPAEKKYMNSPSSPPDRDGAGRAFITGLNLKDNRNDERSRARVQPKLILESVPGAGPRIVEHHDELRKLAETLDQRVAALLKEHEKDFFLAYKTHMYNVQKEFKQLKQKADDEETKTRKDMKIQSLEKELEWFMNEALRLDDLCKGYKRFVDQWKSKAEALDEDRRFLEDQIKGAKRQNKVLRAAVERAQSSAYSALMMNRAKGDSKGGDADHEAFDHGEPYDRPASHGGEMYEGGYSGRGKGNGMLPAIGQDGRHTHHGMAAGTGNKELAVRGPTKTPEYVMPSSPHALLGNDAEQRYVDTIRHLKEQIEKERANVRMLRAARSNSYTKKSLLEEFFLRCIDEARKDVVRRRHLTMDREKSQNEKVLEVLLSSEDVLVFLYEKIFPHRTGMAKHFMDSNGIPGAALNPCTA